jgi:SAM-dependent methyltransferase
MAAPRARVREILALLAELSPRRVVDLGSGGGQLLAEVSSHCPGIALAGIDISSAQVAENVRRLPAIDWHVANLDVPDSTPRALAHTFDVVIASEIVEHLDHPESLLQNAHQLARPGAGHLILSTQSGVVRETERRVGHRRHWTRQEMTTLLLRTGWKPLRVWNSGFPFHDLSKWYANRDPGASMERFAERPYGFWEDTICCALRGAFRFNSRRSGAQLFAVAQRADS